MVQNHRHQPYHFLPKDAPMSICRETEHSRALKMSSHRPTIQISSRIFIRNVIQFNRISKPTSLCLFPRYFYLYRISYLWYSPIGFCITLFGGWIVSLIFTGCGMGGERVIYLDEEKRMINADLFSPPIAKRLRLENAKYLENHFSVSYN